MRLSAAVLLLPLLACESKVDRYIRLKELSRDMHQRVETAGALRQNLDREMMERGVQTDLIKRKDSIDKSFSPAFADSLRRIDAELELMGKGR